jgi:peptide/nickel transport system permease protein
VTGFLARRALAGLFVLWLISVVVFWLFYVLPGDVARTLAGRQASEETVAAVRRTLGLDDPLREQYARFLSGLAHGDLGRSFRGDQPVSTILAERLPVTLSLALGAALLWLVVGVASGVLAGRRPRTLTDRGVTAAALLFYSMPTFLLGQLLLYFLFYRLSLAGVDIFPPGGYAPLASNPVQWARHLALPWLTLALVQAATYARLTRASLLDVAGQDFIRTARAKGLRESRVTVRHELRPALSPVTTQFGIDMGALLGGVVVVETVFGLNGLGRLAVTAVHDQDRPVIIGLVLLGAFFVVLANIFVDATYAVLDPRIRHVR